MSKTKKLQGEPHHIALEIYKIKHFKTSALKILKSKAYSVIILDPVKNMELKNLLLILYLASILI